MKKDRKVTQITGIYNGLFSNAEALRDKLRQNPELLDGCQAVVEGKWQDAFGGIPELSLLKPCDDQTVNYFTRWCLFKLSSKVISKKDEDWVTVTEKKLDGEFASLRQKAGRFFVPLRVEPMTLWLISQLFLYYFYFSKNTNTAQASLVVEAMPVMINALLMIYMAVTITAENRSLSRLLRDCYLNYTEGSTLSHEEHQLWLLKNDIDTQSTSNKLFPIDDDLPTLERATPK